MLSLHPHRRCDIRDMFCTPFVCTAVCNNSYTLFSVANLFCFSTWMLSIRRVRMFFRTGRSGVDKRGNASCLVLATFSGVAWDAVPPSNCCNLDYDTSVGCNPCIMYAGKKFFCAATWSSNIRVQQIAFCTIRTDVSPRRDKSCIANYFVLLTSSDIETSVTLPLSFCNLDGYISVGSNHCTMYECYALFCFATCLSNNFLWRAAICISRKDAARPSKSRCCLFEDRNTYIDRTRFFKLGLFWYQHYPKLHAMVSYPCSRTVNWTNSCTSSEAVLIFPRQCWKMIIWFSKGSEI